MRQLTARRETTIYCPRSVEIDWKRSGLAKEWSRQYSQIFDADDLRIALTQPNKHFVEWFTAIHIFQRHGLCSLVEKAQFTRRHQRKREIISRLMTPERFKAIRAVCDGCEVQWPDLLVYRSDFRKYWFVEVKGPSDEVFPEQLRSHYRLQAVLGIPVRIFNVVIG